MNTVQRTTVTIMSKYDDAKMDIHFDIGERMRQAKMQFEAQMAALEAEERRRLAEAKEAKDQMLGQLWAANPIDFDTEDEE